MSEPRGLSKTALITILGAVAAELLAGAQLAAATAKPPSTVRSKRMADGKLWLVENIRVASVPAYCYNDSKQNCTVYGGLYTFEAAMRACMTLGGGWRLPSDVEWRNLAKQYGGVSADAEDRGKAAYRALMTGGSSGFAAVLGGGRAMDGEYARLDAHGFYWSASDDGPGTAVFYNFGKGGIAFHRQPGGEKDRAFSVRCVKD